MTLSHKIVFWLAVLLLIAVVIGGLAYDRHRWERLAHEAAARVSTLEAEKEITKEVVEATTKLQDKQVKRRKKVQEETKETGRTYFEGDYDW